MMKLFRSLIHYDFYLRQNKIENVDEVDSETFSEFQSKLKRKKINKFRQNLFPR